MSQRFRDLESRVEPQATDSTWSGIAATKKNLTAEARSTQRKHRDLGHGKTRVDCTSFCCPRRMPRCAGRSLPEPPRASAPCCGLSIRCDRFNRRACPGRPRQRRQQKLVQSTRRPCGSSRICVRRWSCKDRICREGSKFGCPSQHQTLIHPSLNRFSIKDETSSGSLLPIVSMMQAAAARG